MQDAAMAEKDPGPAAIGTETDNATWTPASQTVAMGQQH
jgi:hypothetical protein